MGVSISGFLTLTCIIFCFSISCATSASDCDSFLLCFYSKTKLSKSNSTVIFTKNSPLFTSILQSSTRNLRFASNSTPKPELIVLPSHRSHIQASIVCARKAPLMVRVRSGGHDYEGISYVAQVPFIIIDIANLRSIKIDLESETAWVESGATLGQLYHKIAEQSEVHGFPAGSCPTVGVGGHVSGGGFGTIFRKYGLAADNVVDAMMVDVNGRILDRKSMGEDLFWAIRGGGGASFGVIFAWKIKLVHVPSKVTVFNVGKTLEQGATKLLYKWQTIADKLHEDLFLHALVSVVEGTENSNRTVQVTFVSLFLGGVDNLLVLMNESFPELGVQRINCTEMSWIESVLYFADFSTGESYDVLLNRTQKYVSSFKAKSDYVKDPISESGLEGLWKTMLEAETAFMILTPFGGKMSRIGDSETPFPHRSGNIYAIQYTTSWEAENETERHVEWIRRLHAYMAPYVSKNPRSAYINYRDLDLGTNDNASSGLASFERASVWGSKYFKNNFKRLAQIKTKVDPSNFFRNEQSIPLYP